MTGSGFDAAVRAVVDGDVVALRSYLALDPTLSQARSSEAHRATLLHYVAANGVEEELQRTPSNALEVCEVLLAAGADPDAVLEGYGGGENQTPLCLLVSSWHPFAAGVQSDLVRVLVQGGAAVDGRQGDGAPLATALVFGYSAAARSLAELGARMDNLNVAAGLGDVSRVQGWFADGQVRAAALDKYVPPIPRPTPTEPAGVAQEALHFAVTHGHRDVAAYLLERGATVDGTVVGQHCATPLLQAAFVHEVAMACWLLDRGADPDRIDDKRGVSTRAHVAASGPDALRERLARDAAS